MWMILLIAEATSDAGIQGRKFKKTLKWY